MNKMSIERKKQQIKVFQFMLGISGNYGRIETFEYFSKFYQKNLEG